MMLHNAKRSIFMYPLYLKVTKSMFTKLDITFVP